MKSNICALLAFLFVAGIAWPNPSIAASREMERLDRGVVAINTGSGIYVGWRLLGTDPADVAFNVYRGATKLNASPITDSTNFQDPSGSTGHSYTIVPVVNGEEQLASDPVTPWDSFVHTIPLEPRSGYEANDASVGDLDGDGDYELVLKRLSTDQTHGSTSFHYIEAYHMDGTLMWAINLGPNNLFAPHEINPIVYDFDGDGRAEVVLRTCEGNIDGTGVQIGDVDGDGITDYRSTAVLNSSYYMIDGPEFISVFDGLTGAELDRVDYIERDPISQWGLPGMSDSQYGHRADKCMLTPAYLNGNTPSLVISRGIYHKIVLEAWNFRNGSLTYEWTFDSDYWPGYDGQGNHNLTVGDVDGDGFDEIVYGQMTVDHDGTGLYTTLYGHGDAIHMGKMIPGSANLQIYGVHESYPYGADLRDSATGAIIWSHTAAGDTGRGCAAHIDANYTGYQMWDVDSGGTFDASTSTMISPNLPNWGNFLIWWTADLQRELLDGAGSPPAGPTIDKWDSVTGRAARYISLYNYPFAYASKCNNHTKNNPCLSGDLIGDWREEVIYPSSDNTKLYMYATTELTSHRIYTLMHDSQYRTAIAWQCNQYNQPPHPSFYIGAGMSTPPMPDIFMPGDTNAPAAPTGLTALENGSQIALNWAANSEPDLAGYKVYRSTVSGGPYTLIADNVTENLYTDKGVDSGTTYYYAVLARDLSGNVSLYSSEVSATGQPGLIAYYPFNGNLNDGSGNGNDATATGSPTYTGGNPGQSINLDGTDDYLTLPPGLVNLTDITIATWVYWDGSSAWQRIFDFGNNTTEYMFMTPKNGENDMLRFAITTASAGGEQKINTAQLATGQWVHLAIKLEGNTATLYVDGSPVNSKTIFTIDPIDLSPVNNYIGKSQWPDDLFNGRIDEFMVFNHAIDDASISNLAAGIDVLPPAPPVGLAATGGAGALTLDWDDNVEPDIGTYTVYRSTTSGSGYSAIASGLATSDYTDNTVVSGTTYYYVVTATDTSAHESFYSTQIVGDITPPAAPAGLSATAGDSSVSLDWADNTDPDWASYTVYRSTVSGSGYAAIASGLDMSEYIDDSALNDTMYYYVVTALDTSSNESGNSAESNAMPKAAIIPPVSPLAYYRFEEGSAGSPASTTGDVIVDSAGDDDDMNVAGSSFAPTYTTNVINSPVPQTAQPNSLSLVFDGDDYLREAIDGPLKTDVIGDVTVEAFVRVTDLSGWQTFIGRNDDGGSSNGQDGNPQALFYLSKSGINDAFRVELSNASGNMISVDSAYVMTANVWYHLAAVGDAGAGTLTLYVDGVNVGATVGYNGLFDPSNDNPWTIGRGQFQGNPGDYVTGSIDEVRITAAALTPNQFLNHYNPDTDADGLADAWEMDQFGNLDQTGTDDPDGDGEDNETEETNGTPPTISSIPPTIGMVITNGMLNLNWSSNHIGWRLFYNTNLMTNVWTEMPGSEGTNAYDTMMDALPSDNVFYLLVYP